MELSTPIWGATRSRCGFECKVSFQFTHPYRARRGIGIRPVIAILELQFTHPYGVRHRSHYKTFFLYTFQFTHPYGVRRQNGAAQVGATVQFQFTHPYGVRHVKEIRADMETQVSIHAPIWGATPYGLAPGDEFSAFQFTHPYGVRPTITFTLSVHYRFNSRTHMGCDIAQTQKVRLDNVSIHAPIWGATGSSISACPGIFCFNSRTHMGCDIG